jgi:hypothetical protein
MAIRYTSYFDRLPKIKYDINRNLANPNYEDVTNIFFRIRVIQEVLDNINSYFVAEVEEGETPEIIAEKVYGDSGANWMIIVANKIIDPQWDWPLGYDEFIKYIEGKYGSIENAQTTNHHYDMVVTRTLSPDNITTERRYTVNGEKLTDNNLTVPYNYYFPSVFLNDVLTDNTSITVDSTAYTVDSGYDEQDPGEFGLQPGSLAFTQYVNNYNIAGKTVTEIVKGEAVTNYDYEEQLNESRRFIKIIKRDYYDRIQEEFNSLTGSGASFLRRVI